MRTTPTVTKPQPTATATPTAPVSLTRLRLSAGEVTTVFDSAAPRLDPAKIRARSRSPNELKANNYLVNSVVYWTCM